MDWVIACVGCGMDPSTDALLINAAIAGVVSGPWFLRNHLMSIARGIRRRGGHERLPASSCTLPTAEDDDLTGH